MTEMLSTLTEAGAWFMTQASTVGKTIVETPFLLVSCVVPILGGAFGLFFRLMRRS